MNHKTSSKTHPINMRFLLSCLAMQRVVLATTLQLYTLCRVVYPGERNGGLEIRLHFVNTVGLRKFEKIC